MDVLTLAICQLPAGCEIVLFMVENKMTCTNRGKGRDKEIRSRSLVEERRDKTKRSDLVRKT